MVSNPETPVKFHHFFELSIRVWSTRNLVMTQASY